MVKFAMWCSDVYGTFVTDVMLAHHTQVTEAARTKMEAKLAEKDAKLAEKDAKIAKKKAKLEAKQVELEEKRTLVKKKDKKIDKLEAMVKDLLKRQEASDREAAKRDRRASKRDRQAQSTMGLMREDLGEVKDDLQHVRGDLQQVSRKLGVAKKHRVIPADDPQSQHVLVLCRLNQDQDSDDSEDSESSEDDANRGCTNSIHRVQYKCLASTLASKRRAYPNLEVVLQLTTPNSINLWTRCRERYGHRMATRGSEIRFLGSYTEAKLIRDIEHLHRARMTDAGL